MSEVEVDFSDVEEAEPLSFDPLPRAKYPLEVDESTYSESQSGNPMITLRFEVTDGEFAGRKLWDRIVLTDNPKAHPFLKRKLRVLLGEKAMKKLGRVDAEWMENLADNGKLIGTQVIAQVKVSKNRDTGERNNEIAALYAPDEVEVADEAFA